MSQLLETVYFAGFEKFFIKQSNTTISENDLNPPREDPERNKKLICFNSPSTSFKR